MKVVILAGGFGTRISEESQFKPKPMIEIGEKPILWHIMKIYSHYGFNDFIICCGYKAYVIKEFFANYLIRNSDVTIDFSNSGSMEVHNDFTENWKVTLVDTGLNTQTGGRLKRVQKYIGNEPFMMTYGDGVSNVDLIKALEYHKDNNRKATITAVQPGGKFGALSIEPNGKVDSFIEKRKEDGGWINGGFMVFEPSIFELLDGDDCILERIPLETLAQTGELDAYNHTGFWQCMDAIRDKEQLEKLWASGNAPWKIWG